MSYTYDTTTSLGRVRLLIPDRVEADAVFSDEELTAYLDLNSDNVYRAAADALETAASSLALTLRVTKLLDASVDGAKPADILLKRAAKLRQRADDEDASADDGAFDIAEMVVNKSSYQQRYVNQILRGY